jgi:uncharacterized membrane protein YjfL (UPF0719 family)
MRVNPVDQVKRSERILTEAKRWGAIAVVLLSLVFFFFKILFF